MRKKFDKIHFIEHIEIKNPRKFEKKMREPISILSYNLFNFNDNWKLRFNLIIEMIKLRDIDVLCFQEIRFSGENESNFQFDFLKELLVPLGYIYHTFDCSMIYQHDNEEEGLAIFSKHPIISTEKKLLNRNLNDELSHQRILIYSEIEASDGNIIQVFNTHLSLNLDSNFQNAKEIVKFMKTKKSMKNTQILVGDMNAEPNTKSIQYFKKYYKDSWEVFGKNPKLEFTFPTKNPHKRIDFIFFESETLKLNQFEIINQNFNGVNSSDHFGLEFIQQFQLIKIKMEELLGNISLKIDRIQQKQSIFDFSILNYQLGPTLGFLVIVICLIINIHWVLSYPGFIEDFKNNMRIIKVLTIYAFKRYLCRQTADDMNPKLFYGESEFITKGSLFSTKSPFEFRSQETDANKDLYIGQKEVDPVFFESWSLSGDGSMSLKIKSYKGLDALQQAHLLLMVRSDVDLKNPMVCLALKNEVNIGFDNGYTKFMYRSVSGNVPTSTSIRNPILSKMYFSFAKLTRKGKTIIAYLSDDEVTWHKINSVDIQLGDKAIWAIGQDPTTAEVVQSGVIFEKVKFYGFGSGCETNQFYHWDTERCEAIQNFNECGSNQWRYKFFSALSEGNNQLNDYEPVLQINADSIVINSMIKNGYGDKELTDQMVLAFKQLSGDGRLTAKISEITGSVLNSGGVGIRQDLNNIEGKGSIIALCGIPREADPIFQFRTKSADPSKYIVYGSKTSADLSYFVRIEKVGDAITCSYSLDNKNYIKSEPQIIKFGSGTIYVGIFQFSEDKTPTSTKYTEITYEGFKGYCNDHAKFCLPNSGKLDFCKCDSGYSGDFCEKFTCYGIENDNTNVCNSHGSCTALDNCICESTFTGNNCSIPICHGKPATDANVCNSHGSCIAPNTCSCFGGYSGSQCETPICFGYSSTDTRVCSNSKGTCVVADTCSCNTGYTGVQCQIPLCNNTQNPMACSGSNGTCVDVDTCTCTTGHSGKNCELNICFGLNSNVNSVCSSQGNCDGPDYCVCNSGYQGSNCEIPICYGQIDPIACSGENGTCIKPNDCKCSVGYSGSECNLKKCNGKLSNDPNVCNSRGSCNSPEVCTCQSGYTGIYCSIPICYGNIEPMSCSGTNGTCIDSDTCSCSAGFAGNNCELPICFGRFANDTNVCESHGTCIAPNTCLCNSNYQGSNCQNPICYGIVSTETNTVCSGNGVCTSPDSCSCKKEYYGNQCNIHMCNGKLSNDTTVCSNHGSCIDREKCICENSYTGKDCQYPICFGIGGNDQQQCSTHGSCIAPDVCACKPGWKSKKCNAITCQDLDNCGVLSGHGSCIGANLCSCSSQWSGTNCSDPVCYGISGGSPSVCSSHGTCKNPDNCECFSSGYSGAQCNITVCTEVNDCSSNGYCTGANNCSCFVGWENKNCSTFNCVAQNNCSYPKGNCIGPNSCNCTSQWTGKNCKSPICFGKSSLKTDVCSSHGICVNPDNCTCTNGWDGNNCQYPICESIVSTDPTVCSSKGNCSSPNECTCISGYAGSNCQYTICNGISSRFSVCSSHGNCSAPDVCNCEDGYTGIDCQLPICYGKPANESLACTSNNRGTCTAPNSCSCNADYSGNECENTKCFGVDSTDKKSCSSHGNCTGLNQCNCQPSYYGNNCEFSDLFDFVAGICQIPKCTFNLTDFKLCVEKGVDCYCNKQFSDNLITCDSSFRITAIQFRNTGFSGPIGNMLNFTSLETLDLSHNQINCDQDFIYTLPNSLKTMNLSYNQITGANYEINTTYFSKFENLIMDGNSGCGVYPKTWLENRFTVSTKNHQKSFWCDKLNSEACGKLSLTEQKYTMLPHETFVIITYSTSSECQNQLDDSNVYCRSTKLDHSNSNEFEKSSANLIKSRVICPRDNFLPDIDQYLSIVWKYNSTLSEEISTKLNLVNLPYAHILSIHRHLIYSDNSGQFQNVILTMDQNITIYKKSESDVVKCGIVTDNIFIDAISTSTVGNQVFCSVPLGIPNTGEKKLVLFESTKSQNITLNSVSFWLVNWKFTNPEIAASYIGNILITDIKDNLIPGKDGFNYKLNNTQYSIDFPCSFSSNKIQSCLKSNSITSYPGDISIIPLSLSDGNVVISTVETVFFKKNGVEKIYPDAIVAGTTSDVFVTFNSSTFITALNMTFSCVHQTGNFSAVVINSTTIKCLAVNYPSSQEFLFSIHGIYEKFNIILNNVPIQFFTIKRNLIYPSQSVVSLNGSRDFEFSFVEQISSNLQNSFECELQDSTRIKAVQIDSNEFKCTITSDTHQNFTLWFVDSHGFRNQLSTNLISLYFFKVDLISFNETSPQFGTTGTTYNPVVGLETTNIPSKYQDKISCASFPFSLATVPIGQSKYQCTISSNSAGFKDIGLKFNREFEYKIPKVHNTFKRYINLRYDFNFAIEDDFYLKFTMNTQNIIAAGEMKNDCSDLIVTFKGNEIQRNVTSCGTPQSVISFKVQESKTGKIQDYSVYYWNEVANAKVLDIIGTQYSKTPNKILSIGNDELTLNSNFLKFGFFKQFSIFKVDPVASLTTNTSIKLWNDYQDIDYNNQVRFETRYSNEKNSANYTSLFESNLYSSVGKRVNISLWVIYIPTGEELQATLNSLEFFFMDHVQTKYLFPFVEKFSNIESTKNSTIRITTSSDLFTDNGLYCQYSHNGITKYSKASFFNSHTKEIECFVEFENLTQNTELISFDLYMNVSTENQNLNFILTSTNLTFVFFKEPVHFQIPATMTSAHFDTDFKLNFTNPMKIKNQRVSFDAFTIKLKPEIPQNPSSFLNCNFAELTPTCKFQNLTFSHTPMKLDYEMEVISSHFPVNNVKFRINSNIFKQNVTFNTEFPYVGDAIQHQTNPLTIEFNISKKLHPNYQFYCLIDYERIPITRTASEEVFLCSFKSKGVEEDVKISLGIDSTIDGLFGIISNEKSIIQMVLLKFVPEFSTYSEVNSLVIKKNDSMPFLVPEKYRSISHQIQSETGEVFGCMNKKFGNGSLSCSKGNIPMILLGIDITLKRFKLQYKISSIHVDLVSIRQKLILHSNHQITSLSPLAALRGNNLNVTLEFDGTALEDNIGIPIDFYCEYNQIGSLASKIDSKSMKCPVRFIHHDLSNIKFKSYFRVPSMAVDKEIFMTLTDSNTFYYLNSSKIVFTNTNQTLFYLTTEIANYFVNITTLIPPHLLDKFQTKLSDASDFSDSNSYISSNANTHQFKSSTTTLFGGKKELSLWYRENEYSFQISSNSLEVVYAVPALITGLSPSAIIVNRTTTLTISTGFQTNLDYGSGINFTCKYGTNESKYAGSSHATFNSNGLFFCPIQSSIEGKIFVSVWMKAKGVERKITVVDESLLILDSNFFTPSIGFPTGNQVVKIFDYTNPESNVTFNDPFLHKYFFDCEKITTILECQTPVLSNTTAIFNSYGLSFTKFSKNLSIPWILYEEREIINLHPKYIPSNVLNFHINLTFSDSISIQEGSLFFIFSPETNERKDFDFGSVQNSIDVSKPISPFASEKNGIFEIQLFYQNQNSIEFRNMFPISKKQNVTFISKSSIQLTSETNLFNIGMKTNITIKFDEISKLKLNPIEKQFIKCKLGSNFVRSFIKSSEEFICEIESSTAKLDALSMYFIHDSALEQEILLSKNSIPIVFVDRIVINSVLPTSTISSEQQISFETNYNNLYGSTVSYKCSYGSPIQISFANLIDGYFNCTIRKQGLNATSMNVSIIVESKLKGNYLPFSNNSKEFFFMNQIDLLSISPHGEAYLELSKKQRTVKLSLKDDLITTKNVYCKYTSNEGTKYSRVRYYQQQKNGISCEIQKSMFSESVDIIDIQLDDIQWTTPKVIEPKNLIVELNYFIPFRNQFKFEIQLLLNLANESTKLLSCNSVLGSRIKCNLPKDFLESIKIVPIQLNFTFIVTHKHSLESFTVQIDRLHFYQSIEFQHIKPHYISYNERLNYPFRLIGNTNLSLNSKEYRFICTITQNGTSILKNATFDLKESEYQPNLNRTSHFACTFNSFGSKTENYELTLSFNSVNGNNLLTKNSSTIYVFEKGFTLNKFYGSNKGGYEIGKVTFSKKLPTSTYNDYSYSLKLQDRNSEIPITKATFIGDGFVFTMVDVSQYYKLWNVVERRMKLNLYINGIRAISFFPLFTFFQITIDEISPSTKVKLNTKTMLTFKIKEKFNQKHQVSVKFVNDYGEIKTESCKLSLENSIQCFSPSFDKIALNVRIYFSINSGPEFDTEKSLQIYDEKTLQFLSISPKLLSPYTTNEVVINGYFMKNESTVKIRYTNSRLITEIVDVLNNDTTIISKPPSFFLTNHEASVNTIQIEVSFDNGNYFQMTNLTVEFGSIDPIILKPSKVPQNLPFSMELISVPLIHFSKDNVSFILVSSSNSILLTCNVLFNKCNSINSNQIIPGTYTLNIFVNSDISNLISSKLTVYETPIFGKVLPEIFYREMSSPISILGSKFTTDDIVILLSSTNNLFASSNNKSVSIKVKPIYSNGNSISVNLPKINETTLTLYISFNGGEYYHPIKDVQIIETPNFELIKNQDSLRKDSTGFSFRDSNLQLIGQFFYTSPLKIRVSNQLATKVYNSSYTIKSSNLIEFNLPQIYDLDLPFAISFPVTFKFGISFNDGYEYFERDILYLDKYTTLFLFQANPSILARKAQKLSIQGIGFEYAEKCQIKKNGILIYESNIEKVSTSQVFCNITDSSILQGGVTSLDLFVSNVFNDSSNVFKLTVYDDPIPLSLSRSSGLTIGNFSIGITVNEVTDDKIYCKFGSLECENPCVTVNSTFIICHVDAYPTGTFTFYIGYNKIDWNFNPLLNFTFIPCDAGYTAETYSTNCYPCPQGTYKLTSGLYDCISCPKNQYSNATGSTTCIQCPNKKVSIEKSTSIESCVCDKGFYKNPANEKECYTCPVGAICSKENLTIPEALPGYWFSRNDINSFYLCNPKQACGGGKDGNCTIGYTGLRCGYCSLDYYKSKNKCQACACLLRGVSFVPLWIVKMLIPLGLVVLFIGIYIFSELRSLFAGTIGHKIVKAMNIKYLRPPDIEPEMSKFQSFQIWFIRQIIWLYNLAIWVPRHKSTRQDFKILFNRLLNTFSAYISFLYIFMMTTASEIFVCTAQKNGSYTMNESADILCFKDEWWALFPIAFIWYAIFGFGILVYFGLMVIQRKKNKNDELFQLRFRFVLLRFKNKFFYWKIVETVRLMVITMLNIFFQPLFVITLSLGIIFIALLLHLQFVPFKRKFHNIMEYIMLLATLLTLFFGLLFLSSKNIERGIGIFIEIISIGIIVLSNVLAVGMTIWDIYTRRKNIGKRAKKERRNTRNMKARKVIIKEDKEYDFHYNWRKWNISSDEDSKLTMNQIFENLFSFGRVKRKVYLISRKGKKVAKKVGKVKNVIPIVAGTFIEHKDEKEKPVEDDEYYNAHRNFLEGLPVKKVQPESKIEE
eukprot:gene8579-404_t